MRFVLERVSPPAIELFTLAEMKTNLREFANMTARDAEITQLIQSAREWVEEYTGRAMVDQTWRQTVVMDTLDRPTGIPEWQAMRPGIPLYMSPILALTSFVTVAADGTEEDVTADTYEVQGPGSKWPRLVALDGSSWSTGTFGISFRAGFADQTGSPQTGAEVVPARFLTAMKLWAQGVYNADDKTIEAATNLIRPERVNLNFA